MTRRGCLHLRPVQNFLLPLIHLGDPRVRRVVADHLVPHLQWWLDPHNVLEGIPLSDFHPNVDVFTDASGVGWVRIFIHSFIGYLYCAHIQAPDGMYFSAAIQRSARPHGPYICFSCTHSQLGELGHLVTVPCPSILHVTVPVIGCISSGHLTTVSWDPLSAQGCVPHTRGSDNTDSPQHG